MGKEQSKIVKPNANVVNTVEVTENINLKQIEICLIIITILLGLQFIYQIYAIHHKNLKKKYVSRANDLDKI